MKQIVKQFSTDALDCQRLKRPSWRYCFLEVRINRCLPDSPKPVSPKLGFRVRVRVAFRRIGTEPDQSMYIRVRLVSVITCFSTLQIWCLVLFVCIFRQSLHIWILECYFITVVLYQRGVTYTAVSRPGIVLAPRDLSVPVLSTRGPCLSKLSLYYFALGEHSPDSPKR